MPHTSFAITTRGLNRDLLPMRLYEKAKRLGRWIPSDLDFARDKADWATLNEDEKALLLPLLATLMAGEEEINHLAKETEDA